VFKLRPYQEEAVLSINKYFIAQRGSNPIVVAPTAAGKSIMIAEYCKRNLSLYPDCRFLMLTHQKELIEQNFAKLKSLWAECDAGIFSASVGRKEADNKIVFAGIQSVYNKAELLGKFDVILVDECHMIPKRGNGMYRTFLDGMRKINPLLKMVGFTATPYRLNGGYLYEGKDRLFDGIAYDIPVKTLLDAGYIAPLVTPDNKLPQADLSDVETVAGEYKGYQLSAAVNKDDLVKRAVHQMWVHGSDRSHWLAFAVDIEHAETICKFIQLKGITCEVITGKTKRKERERLLADFSTGAIHCLVNVGVLTTGFDEPQIGLVALFRPTQSTSLYIQMLGRGVRIFPSKINCLVMDFAQNIFTHGNFDDPEIGAQAQSTNGEGEAPTRKCEQCEEDVHAAVKVCPFCGFNFPEPEAQPHSDIASTLALYSTEKGETVYDIDELAFHMHRKSGQPDSCRVEYLVEGRVRAKEWLCFEHIGRAKLRACNWWQAVMPDHELPFSSLNAAIVLNHNARTRIIQIKIKRNGKYKDLVARKLRKLIATN
jgi:DNA repair protein RadD